MEINSFERRYRKEDICEYERIVAAEDISGAFLRTSFIEDGDVITAIYRYDGYLKASSCKFRYEVQVINLVERVLKRLIDAGNCYICADRLLISADTVFYNPENEDVRVAFIISEEHGFRRELMEFIQRMKKNFSLEDTPMIDELLDYLSLCPHSMKDTIKKIEKMKKSFPKVQIKTCQE